MSFPTVNRLRGPRLGLRQGFEATALDRLLHMSQKSGLRYWVSSVYEKSSVLRSVLWEEPMLRKIRKYINNNRLG